MPTKLTAWASKREGTLNKFYTRLDVGDLLAREIGPISPETILDLGAGEGSLSAAVIRRWPEAATTTVDVHPSCTDKLRRNLSAAGCERHEHYVLDALNYGMPSELEKQAFDLAVCNPPFYRPDWKREFADILSDANLAEACPTAAEATAEIIFLAQNIRLVKTGGTIALIIPDGLATGWRYMAFRRALLRQHTVRTTVQLPPYSFFETEAYCFIVILDKGRACEQAPVKLLRLHDDGAISEPIFVEPASAETRFDYAYHCAAQSPSLEAKSLRQLGAEIRRGSLSTVQRKAADAFVFHTGDFPAGALAVSLDTQVPDMDARQLVIAEAGDILMARVDRDLHNKVTFVEVGRAAITDCVYRIRLPEQHRKRVFKALTSQHGKERVRAATKGVGARLIGKGDLLDLPLVFSD